MKVLLLLLLRTQKASAGMRGESDDGKSNEMGKQINNFVLCDCKLVTRAKPHSVPMVFGCDFIAFVVSVSFILKVYVRITLKKGNTSSNDVK